MGGLPGILRGLDWSVVAGQMQLSLTAGAAMVAERDGSNVELARGYLVWNDAASVVQFGVASAGARNDAVVIAAVDVEDGAQGTGNIGVGGHLVVVPGVSGTTTPRTDAQIQAFLGRGGWTRYADVAIPASSTQIAAGNVVNRYQKLNGPPQRLYRVKQTAENVVASQTLQNDDDLFLDLPVGVWEVECKMTVGCSSGVAADIKTAWTFSGTSTGTTGRLCDGPTPLSTDVTATSMRRSSHGLGTSVPFGVDDVSGAVIMEHITLNVTAPGRLQLQWAQNGSSSSTTSMNVGSRVMALRQD